MNHHKSISYDKFVTDLCDRAKHTQDPIKIADGDKDLTPRDILKIIEGAVAVNRNDENRAENAESNLLPLFVCTMHITLKYIEAYQSKYGVLIRMFCSQLIFF